MPVYRLGVDIDARAAHCRGAPPLPKRTPLERLRFWFKLRRTTHGSTSKQAHGGAA